MANATTDSRSKVTVACKIGVAWLNLQLCEEREVMENTQTGPRTVKQFARTGSIVRIRGTAYPRGTPPTGFPDRPQMVNGYALTHGVDKAFWDKWLKQNEKAPFVVSGMIMAHENIDYIRGPAKERVAQLSGLEPLRPDSDPRVPKSTNAAVTNVETEETRRAKMSLTDAA